MRLLSSKSKRLSEALVREREAGHEKKLGVAKLTENLVHEEFHISVKEVYDFRQVLLPLNPHSHTSDRRA